MHGACGRACTWFGLSVRGNDEITPDGGDQPQLEAIVHVQLKNS
jgi:hypothetical protein